MLGVDGRTLIDDLLSDDRARVSAARTALKAGSQQIENEATKQLCRRVKERNARALSVIAEGHYPDLGQRNWNRLFGALATAKIDESVRQRAMARMMARTPAKDHRRSGNSKETAPSSKALVPRILSVFTRHWVWVVLGMTALAAAVLFSVGARLPAVLGFAGMVVLCVLVDAVKRRCTCGRYLAGHLLSITHGGSHTEQVTLPDGSYANRTVNTWNHNWQCVFCGSRWTT